MANLSYYPKEIELLPDFHGVEIIIYVEGRGDKAFWEDFLKDSEIKNSYYIEIAGCKEEIEKIIDLILKGEQNLIAISDNDYSEILGTQVIHDRVVYTYGYSIENSLFCPNILASIIAIYTGAENLEQHKSELKDWYELFCKECFLLLVYDLANRRYKKNITVMGKSSHRFLMNGASPYLDPKKTKKILEGIREHFSDKEISKCAKKLEKDEREIRYLIRGHFLTEPVIRLIRKIVYDKTHRNLKISHDIIFTLPLNRCMRCICLDKSQTESAIQKAFFSIKNN